MRCVMSLVGWTTTEEAVFDLLEGVGMSHHVEIAVCITVYGKSRANKNVTKLKIIT